MKVLSRRRARRGHRPARPPRPARRTRDLTAARDLYASAAYDDALTVLNRLRSAEHPASQSRAIEQYRAFCLLALGRAADAEQAIEAVVAAEPSYPAGRERRVAAHPLGVHHGPPPDAAVDHPAEVRAGEGGVRSQGVRRRRRRLHPGADRAGRSGRRGRSQAAAAVRSAHARRRLPGARGQGRGAAAAAAAGAGRRRAAAAATAGRRRASTPAAKRASSPPVVVNQTLPPFPGPGHHPAQRQARSRDRRDRRRRVRDHDRVGDARTTTRWCSPPPRAWRYRPATLNGVPVKFRKTVQITIKLSS